MVGPFFAALFSETVFHATIVGCLTVGLWQVFKLRMAVISYLRLIATAVTKTAAEQYV
jgi:hypothetical protein